MTDLRHKKQISVKPNGPIYKNVYVGERGVETFLSHLYLSIFHGDVDLSEIF